MQINAYFGSFNCQETLAMTSPNELNCSVLTRVGCVEKDERDQSD